jgi:hypothetical protein
MLAARVELQPLVVLSTAPFGRGALVKKFSVCASSPGIGMLLLPTKPSLTMTENQ